MFYVVAASHVENYEFQLYQLLEFDPNSGKTSVLVALPVNHGITAAIFDAQSRLIVLAVEADSGEDSDSISHLTAIFDTRTAAVTWQTYSSADLPQFAGFDPVQGKTLVIQNVGEERPKTNYNVGHLTCSSDTGCNVTSMGELAQLWSGPNTGYGPADKIFGFAWDPSERLLSVQSSGCYNISLGNFDCYSNLGTEKFLQYHIPASHSGSSLPVLTASYTYVQVTDYNDGLAMNWSGLASVATP